MSKFALADLQEAVFPFVTTAAPDLILGATFGEDVALVQADGAIVAAHVDPIVGAIVNIGWLAVHVACNDIASSGIAPRWLLLLVLVPRADDTALLRQIMCDARRAADEVGALIVGGHSGYSAGVTRPLVAVTALGVADRFKPVQTAGAKVGDLLLVTKGIALEGTAILAHDFADVARRHGLTEDDLQAARGLMEAISVVPEGVALAGQGVTAMHDATRGGLLEALLEMAQRSAVGIELEFDQLPLPPIVARFAEAFAFDPLRMISSGTLVATLPPACVADAMQILANLGIVHAMAGRVTAVPGVRVRRAGKTEVYSEVQCEADELARLWELYPRRRQA